MKNLICTQLTTLLLITQLVSCDEKANESRNKERKASELALYFQTNAWQFPIEIDTSGIQIDKNIRLGNNLAPTFLKQKILDWCISDSILTKHYNDQCIRISDIGISPLETKYKLTCRIDFYSEGEIKDGLVAPVEGHAIVDNKFLRQREFAVLYLANDTVKLSNWVQ